MKATRTAVLTLTLAIGLSALALTGTSDPASAAGLSKKRAMAICRAKYGLGITDVVIRKNGQVVCQEGPPEGATRKEVFAWCKKHLDAKMLIVQKRGKRWQCLYSGNY